MTNNQNVDLEKIANKAEGAQFLYHPISKGEYNRDTFVITQDQLNDIEKYKGALDKDPHNIKAREGICKIAWGDKKAHLNYSPEQMRITAKELYNSGAEGMGRYVEDNKNKFFDMLDGKALQNLAMSLPLYKNGKKGHDDLVNLINDINSMGKAINEGKIDEMRNRVDKLAKSEEVEKWAKDLLKYFSGDQRFVQEVYTKSFILKQNVLGNAITKNEKIDKGKIRNLLGDSLKVAYDEEKDEKDEDKKKNIWEDCIRIYYLGMAKYAFGPEKEAFEDDNEELRKRIKREKHRFELGMPA